jgi:hypothetical protein
MKNLVFITTFFLLVLVVSTLFSVEICGEGTDPAKDSPTDDSMNISIDDVEFTTSLEGLNKVKIEQTVTGSTTTTGNTTVHHIGNTLWTYYYENGSVAGGAVDQQPAEGYEYSDDEMTYRVTKKADNWTKWEIEIEMTVRFGLDEQGNLTVTLPKLDRTMIFVRAYSDEEGNNWSQTSVDITEKYKDSWKEMLPSLDLDEDSAGFEAGLLLALVAGVALSRKKRC